MQRFSVIALVLCAFLIASEANAQVLSKSGTCPGPMTFQVTGATPFARLAFIHSANTGSWIVPPGVVCGTTVTGLAAPVTFAGWLTANASGNKTVNINVPGGLCNRYLQVVVLNTSGTCSITNVVQIN